MKLTDEQVSKITSIYDETRARVNEVHEKYQPADGRDHQGSTGQSARQIYPLTRSLNTRKC